MEKSKSYNCSCFGYFDCLTFFNQKRLVTLEADTNITLTLGSSKLQVFSLERGSQRSSAPQVQQHVQTFLG